MQTFRGLRRKLAQFRICLERDVRAGVVPPEAFAEVDGCYAELDSALEAARIELEAAGPPSGELVGSCMAAHAALGRRMFRATRQHEARALVLVAARQRAAARALLHELRGELVSAA